MAPVTALTYGNCYICNYLTGADGDAQDLDGKSEGTDYMYFILPSSIRGANRNVGKTTLYQGGTGHRMKEGKQVFTLKVKGKCATVARYDNCMEYLSRSKDHDHGVEYLFLPKASNDFEHFYDYAHAEKEYAKGSLIDIIFNHSMAKNSIVPLEISFDVYW